MMVVGCIDSCMYLREMAVGGFSDGGSWVQRWWQVDVEIDLSGCRYIVYGLRDDVR